MLDDRKLAVLKAIVTDYVSSREPVGSKALVERHKLDVSSATVRNDMAVLEEEGYITQPHTSAGRIPTDKGYRLFVDRLATIKPLSASERRAIATFMDGAIDLDDLVMRTVRLLAQITHQVAIVQYPVAQSALIRHVELVRLSPERVMVMVINSTGHIEQRTLELPDADEDALADLRGRLNAAAVGKTASAATAEVATLAESLAPEARGSATPILTSVIEALAADPATRVVVGGVPNLAAFGDQFEAKVRPVLEALEEQMVLLHLLGEAATSTDVTVRIGHENPYSRLQSTSVVASPYGSPTEVGATLGVVGPTRMDYPSTIASVRAVARYVSRFLQEG